MVGRTHEIRHLRRIYFLQADFYLRIERWELRRFAQPVLKSPTVPPRDDSFPACSNLCFDEEVDNAASAMTSLLEPIMIVFLAVVVGAIVIAMFLPLLVLINSEDGSPT